MLQPKVVVDLCNVVYKNLQRPRLEDVFQTCDFFSAKGIETILVASSALKHRIDRRKFFEDLVRQNIVYETPAGYDEDIFILEITDEFGAYVLSNDRFRKYTSTYQAVIKRRIPFMFVKGRIIIPIHFIDLLLSKLRVKNSLDGSEPLIQGVEF